MQLIVGDQKLIDYAALKHKEEAIACAKKMLEAIKK